MASRSLVANASLVTKVQLPPRDRAPGGDDRQRLHGGGDAGRRAAAVPAPERRTRGCPLVAAAGPGRPARRCSPRASASPLAALNVYFRDVEHILDGHRPAVDLRRARSSTRFDTVPGPERRVRLGRQPSSTGRTRSRPFIISIQDALFFGRLAGLGRRPVLRSWRPRSPCSAGWSALPAPRARDGGGALMALEPGRIRLRGVSRTFRILHERNLTLKETVLRRRRTDATELWAVRDVDLDVAPGRGDRRHRPERLGQEHAAQAARRDHPAARRAPSRSAARSRRCSSSAPGSTPTSPGARTST